MKIARYSFKARIWKYPGKSGWYFVTLPIKLSKAIRLSHGHSEEGWGRLKTTAQVGQLKWNTSIWFDTKANGYLLPIKSEVRKKEEIGLGTLLNVRLTFELDKYIR